MLADPDRWRGVGGGFVNINAFMGSIRLDTLKSTAEQRKRIALKIKKYQPKVSNRKIAKALGADEMTIRNDTAELSAPGGEKPSNIKAEKTSTAENSALSGSEAAKTVERADRVKSQQAAIGERVANNPSNIMRCISLETRWR